MSASKKAVEWEYNFDFNDLDNIGIPRRSKQRRKSGPSPHVQKAAAQLVRRKADLTNFLQALDRSAALSLGNDKEQNNATEVALTAVVALLDASGQNEAQRFSRVFELLADNLNGGANRQKKIDNIKGATAYLIEYLASLPGQSRRIGKLALDAAHVLSEHMFPFSGKNAGSEGETRGVQRKLKNPLIVARGETIELWRRRYRTKATDPAADIFRKYQKKTPFKTTNDAQANARTAIAWWYEQLFENDY